MHNFLSVFLHRTPLLALIDLTYLPLTLVAAQRPLVKRNVPHTRSLLLTPTAILRFPGHELEKTFFKNFLNLLHLCQQ